mmetsp:Transcript_24523/g.62090  ORF Transcript_24523/g.62090 Transcript_24523/m.62090 type:complete len:222 (-) Transcript_24523:13-678(-)
MDSEPLAAWSWKYRRPVEMCRCEVHRPSGSGVTSCFLPDRQGHRLPLLRSPALLAREAAYEPSSKTLTVLSTSSACSRRHALIISRSMPGREPTASRMSETFRSSSTLSPPFRLSPPPLTSRASRARAGSALGASLGVTSTMTVSVSVMRGVSAAAVVCSGVVGASLSAAATSAASAAGVSCTMRGVSLGSVLQHPRDWPIRGSSAFAVPPPPRAGTPPSS